MKRNIMKALLAAEPAELRGTGETEVARRVREDEAVRKLATSILHQTQALNRALGSSHALARPQAAPPVSALRERRRRAGRAQSFAAAALTAAALLTLLLAQPASPPVSPGAPQRSLTARLDVKADRPFAVIATDNPDIAIVWLFNQED